MNRTIIKAYKKEDAFSYAAGAYAVIELLESCPAQAEEVFLHPEFEDRIGLAERCAKLGIPVHHGAEAFRRINQKENTYVTASFRKKEGQLRHNRPHLALVNPADMGNLGTILRTAAAFSLTDVAIITPAADIFHPKTVRASMGAIFRLNLRCYEDFGDYRAEFPTHACYPFALEGAGLETALEVDTPRFVLLFGNEATGLPPELAQVGFPVRIAQSELVDSLNLSVAAGVGIHAFAQRYGLV